LEQTRAKIMSSRIALKNVMLLIKDVPKAVNFYKEALGCKVNYMSEHWAEVESNNIKIALNKVEGEAPATTGYSPFLCFNVEQMDRVVYKCIEMGASLDGPIKYPSHGKIASLRAPDGHMIGLFEPADKNDF
jgi:predicted enzyme related to lactoylglutathione lyase